MLSRCRATSRIHSDLSITPGRYPPATDHWSSLPGADGASPARPWSVHGGDARHAVLIQAHDVSSLAGAIHSKLVRTAPCDTPPTRGTSLDENPQEGSAYTRLAFRSRRTDWPRRACGSELPHGSRRTCWTHRARLAFRSRRTGRSWWSGLPRWTRRTDFSPCPLLPLWSLGSLMACDTLRPLRSRWAWLPLGAGRTLGSHGSYGTNDP